MREDAELWGIDPDALVHEADTEQVGIWSDNYDAALGFLSVQTQWNYRPRGLDAAVISGLNYDGARAGLEAAGFEVSPSLWGDIITIEAGALEERNKEF